MVAITVAVYCWRHHKARAAKPLAWVMAAVTGYLFFNTLELVSPTPGTTLFFARVGYLFIGLLTVNWFVFALEFSSKEKWLAPRYFRWLWVIPIISVALVFTNDLHHLIWAEYTFIPVGNGFLSMRVIAYGAWFWIFWLHSYFLILSGAVLIFWANITPYGSLQMRSRWALAGAMLPLIFNLIYVLKLIPNFYKDFSPLAYALSGILFAVSIFRYRLLDLAPLARTMLIDHMDDGMLTFDLFYRVVDANPAALRLLQDLQPVTFGEPCLLLTPYLKSFEQGGTTDFLQTEIALQQGEVCRHFDLHLRRLRDQDRLVVGYLITFHNITVHKQLLHETEQLAEQDPLTGVANRRYFMALAQKEAEHAVSQHEKFSILMIDLDSFKKVNDTFGHRAGDQVLQEFSQVLRSALRGTDSIARIGGDEFVVLLPGTELSGALLWANRLHDHVRGHAFRVSPIKSIPLTVSIGAAEFSWQHPTEVEQVMEMADRNLYQAKAEKSDLMV